MNKLNLKEKIFFVSFVIFLMLSAILFNLEQVIFASITLIVALLFAVLFGMQHQKDDK